MTQSLASTVSKRDGLRDLVAGGDADQLADRGLIGRFGEMHGDIPAPVGPSNAAIAAWPSKKLSVSRSTTRLAACSLPMAKVAREVAGVRRDDIRGKLIAAPGAVRPEGRGACSVFQDVIDSRAKPERR